MIWQDDTIVLPPVFLFARYWPERSVFDNENVFAVTLSLPVAFQLFHRLLHIVFFAADDIVDHTPGDKVDRKDCV